MNTLNVIMQKFLNEVKANGIIEIEDIPNIDLYMDQLTTFMDQALVSYKRYDDDKILTKTMINNYTKAKIFPPPIKKKYSPTHMMLLIMIYHLKSILSIRDIGILFTPILTLKNPKEQALMVREIYSAFISLQKFSQTYVERAMEGDNTREYSEREVLENCKNQETKKIALVLLLTIRAYVEKKLAERALDSYFQKI